MHNSLTFTHRMLGIVAYFRVQIMKRRTVNRKGYKSASMYFGGSSPALASGLEELFVIISVSQSKPPT